jgi:hypothetical protein
MLRAIFAILLVLLGIATIGIGVRWKVVFPPQSFWSDAQAREYAEASVALKTTASRPDRPPDQTDDTELASARVRFNKIKGDLDRSIQHREYGGILLAAGGVLLLIAGAAIYAIGNRKEQTIRHY